MILSHAPVMKWHPFSVKIAWHTQKSSKKRQQAIIWLLTVVLLETRPFYAQIYVAASTSSVRQFRTLTSVAIDDFCQRWSIDLLLLLLNTLSAPYTVSTLLQRLSIMIKCCSIEQSRRRVLIKLLNRHQQRIERIEKNVNEYFLKRVLISFLYICFIVLLKKIIIDYINIKNVVL